MEDKEERVEFSKFWDALDDELEMESDNSTNSLVEHKPMLPRKRYPTRPTQTQNGSQVNSIKIERKTPLDSMVRRNQQLKKQSNKMPTYGDIQRLNTPTPVKRIDPIKKPVSYPTFKQQQTQQQKTYQQENQSLYPRYRIQEKSKPTPPVQNNNSSSSYLRAQMLKELRSKQERKPVNLSRERLQPPQVTIPPQSIKYTQQPSPSYTYQEPATYNQDHTSYNQEPTSYNQDNNYNRYFESPVLEPEIIDELELLNCLQNIRDKTKIDVLMKLLDGQWHTDYELIRIAKKSRDFIGVVGFGMLICSIEDTVAKSFLIKKINPGNSSHFKINDNFIELARSAYSQYKKSEN